MFFISGEHSPFLLTHLCLLAFFEFVTASPIEFEIFFTIHSHLLSFVHVLHGRGDRCLMDLDLILILVDELFVFLLASYLHQLLDLLLMTAVRVADLLRLLAIHQLLGLSGAEDLLVARRRVRPALLSSAELRRA